MKTDIFKNAANAVTKVAGRTGLKVKKYSPELLIGGGIVLGFAATVKACQATLKAGDILEEHKAQMETIKEATGLEEYSDADKRKDTATVYFQSTVKLVKVYSPAIILGTLSVTSILAGHNILRKRSLAMAAAYKAVEEGYSNYRKRVVEEMGEEADYRFKHGISKEEIEVVEEDKDGKEKKKKIKSDIQKGEPGPYARIFDDGCRNWSKSPEQNMMFLKNIQNYFNDLLKARGHVFLNEVYEELGFRHTQAGSVVGWVLGNGDDYIDFGLYNIHKEANRDFVNGYERNVLLDFNVDEGVIYDKI